MRLFLPARIYKRMYSDWKEYEFSYRIDDRIDNSISRKSLLSSSLAHLNILGWTIRKRDYYENCALYSARVYTYLRDSSNVDKYHAINSDYTWEAIP